MEGVLVGTLVRNNYSIVILFFLSFSFKLVRRVIEVWKIHSSIITVYCCVAYCWLIFKFLQTILFGTGRKYNSAIFCHSSSDI